MAAGKHFQWAFSNRNRDEGREQQVGYLECAESVEKLLWVILDSVRIFAVNLNVGCPQLLSLCLGVHNITC